MKLGGIVNYRGKSAQSRVVESGSPRLEANGLR